MFARAHAVGRRWRVAAASVLALGALTLAGACGLAYWDGGAPADFSGVELTLGAEQPEMEYVSPEVDAERFTAVFVQMDEAGKGQATVTVRERGVKTGEWGNWEEVKADREEDEGTDFMNGFQNTPGRWAGMVLVAPSNGYQLKIHIAGEAGYGVQNVGVTTRDVTRKSAWTKLLDLLPSANAGVDGVTVISRTDWGADPALLLPQPKPPVAPSEPGEPSSGPAKVSQKVLDCEAWQAASPDEFQNDGENIATTDDGQKLQWSRTYSKKIYKIVIHHTDTPEKDLTGDGAYTADDAAATVRGIYYSHAVVNGWGYEGRSGGDKVVGAHTYCANTGTIGIALIGDYENTQPSKAALAAAAELSGALAVKYKIDLTQQTEWHTKTTAAIVGHRDYGHTTCPGQYLYARLGDILSDATDYAVSHQRSDKNYAYEIETPNASLQLNPLSTDTLSIQIKNIGQQSWAVGTAFGVRERDVTDNAAGVVLASGRNQVARIGEITPPNSVATIQIPATAGMKAGQYRFGVVPYFESKPSDPFFIVVSVADPVVDYAVVKSVFPPRPFPQGTSGTALIQLKNTSNFNWPASGVNRMYLGNVKPKMGKSPFSKEGTQVLAWLDADTPPNGIGTFHFDLVAPDKAGRYTIAFAPAMLQFGYFPDYGMNFDTLVRQPRFSADVGVAPDAVFPMATGGTQVVSIPLKNTSQFDWVPAQFSLEVLQSGTLTVDTAHAGIAGTVKMGESGVLQIPLTAGSAAGTYRVRVKPHWINGHDKTLPVISFIVSVVGDMRVPPQVKPDDGAASDGSATPAASEGAMGYTLARHVSRAAPAATVATTVDATVAQSDGPTIRIRLGFQGDVAAVGGGDFGIQDAEGRERFSGNFATFTTEKLADGRVYRVVPKGDTILQIVNWDHAPAWNENIHDNLYRGILELRESDGVLTIIDELPLEQYVRGIAEPLPTDPTEKSNVLAVLSRSYAYYYLQPENRKFPGEPYDGSDNPAEFQKYLGYNYEARGSMPAASERTRGLVVEYQGAPARTPYFNRSDGRTRAPSEIGWPVGPFPFVQVVEDPWSCDGSSADIGKHLSCPEEKRGHGVGLSGYGATGLANEGKDFREIITYYYKGVDIAQVY